MASKAPERIREALRRRATTIDLSNCELVELPSELKLLARCRNLDLSGNLLAELQDDIIQNLQSLEELSLAFNEFDHLPSQILHLPKLRVLNLSMNRLRELNDSIGNLTALRSLTVARNGLEHISPAIGNLVNLEDLDLSDNTLRDLPQEISNLRKLRELNLSNNWQVLPGPYANDPQMHYAQDTEPPWFVGLESLRMLDLSGNGLQSLPPSLGQLSSNTILNLDENPLETPIPELLNRGVPELLSYLRSLIDGAEKRYEAKLILIGEGNVGKTTLVDALCDRPFIRDRSTTHGIEIQGFRVQHPELDDREIVFRSWDFGGQEVYRVTHQFFFSPRTIYLVVWRPREGQYENAVEGWIRRIRLRVGEDARIIIVATHASERQPELDFSYLRQKFGSMLVGSIQVDSESRLGIDELKLLLAETAAGLGHLGEEISNRWIRIRDALLSEQTPNITYDEYAGLCRSHGVDADEANVLAKLLNDLGYIVYFSDDEGLRNLIVLQPEWLTKAIGYVLEDADTRAHDGLLHHSRLETIWGTEPGTYVRADHPYFLRLMEKFDVSYRIPDEDQSLVGQLVPYERPELDWPPIDRVRRELSLICLLSDETPGLIPWLIVRNRRFDSNKRWRRGVLLRHPQYGSEGLITLPKLTKVELTVRGNSPAYFFHVLRDTLEDLFQRRWPGLEYQLMVPCSTIVSEGTRCPGTFALKALERFQLRERETIVCQECVEDQSVAELLTGFPSAAEGAIERLDRVVDSLATLDHITPLLESAAADVRAVLKMVGTEVVDCPRLFLVRPHDQATWDPRRIWNSSYDLTLWCEEPNQEHSLEPPYNFGRSKEWWARAAPYVSIVGKTIALLAPIAGAVSGLTPEATLKNDFELMKAVADAGPRAEASMANEGTGEASGLTRVEGAGLRAFRELLLELDEAKEFRHLRRVNSMAGDFFWVCPAHYSSYDPGLPRLPYAT
jgi:hypothetical protein